MRVRVVASCLLAGAVTLPAGARATVTTAVVPAAANGNVSDKRPGRGSGASRLLRVGGAAGYRSYLQFRVPRTARVVRRATLRLLPARGSRGTLIVRSLRSNDWAEAHVARGRALLPGRVVGTTSVRAGRWLSVDVTAAVRSARETVTLVVSPRGSAEALLHSRQADAGSAPRLLITTTPDRNVEVAPVVAAAGDIACDPRSRFVGTSLACRDAQTAELLANTDIAAVLTLGDHQYEKGELRAFQAVYDRSWGRFKGMTRPAVGNHEYLTPHAAGYFDYFNGVGRRTGRAGDRAKGYYSFDIGTWHLIALNSMCDEVGGCHAGSPQERWLRVDLGRNRGRCTLAYWHHPRFSSGMQRSSIRSTAFWRALYDAGADVVLAGHAHDYERFAPLRWDGSFDPERGIRQFVVGTGGKFPYPFRAPEPFSEVSDSATSGVLMLTLRAGGYDWRFVPEAHGTFTDAGSGLCR